MWKNQITYFLTIPVNSKATKAPKWLLLCLVIAFRPCLWGSRQSWSPTAPPSLSPPIWSVPLPCRELVSGRRYSNSLYTTLCLQWSLYCYHWGLKWVTYGWKRKWKTTLATCLSPFVIVAFVTVEQKRRLQGAALSPLSEHQVTWLMVNWHKQKQPKSLCR